MGKFDNVEGVAKRVLTLFFLVDVSGSMTGEKIGTVNTTMEEILPTLRKISADNADAMMKMSVLKFSKGAEWVYEKPRDIQEFEWQYLEAKGVTDLGAACMELNEKLSKEEYMKTASGSYAPVIILLSDGEPTDDYRSGLATLKQNNWYKYATKAAIGIGDHADYGVLAEFTEDEDMVITVYDEEELKQWIKFLSVTSSQIAMKGAGVGDGGKSMIHDRIVEEKGEAEKLQKAETENVEEVAEISSAQVVTPIAEGLFGGSDDFSQLVW